MKTITLIGVSGGSGSGKTTLALEFAKRLPQGSAVVLAQDHYYIDQSAKFDGDGGSVNFDHPASLEFSLLAKHLKQLKLGECVEVPIYDFATHTRKATTQKFMPAHFVLVDGTLLFSQPKILEVLDFCVFVDTPEELRFARRLKRDVEERGRTPEGVKKQFLAQVKPMHDQFIETSKHKAHLLISGETSMEDGIAALLKLLNLDPI